jgi:hypothetical protein
MVKPLGADARPVAKAAHRCAECGRVIEPGERYLRERYVWDGKFTVHKTCAHCEVARDWLAQECGGWLYGGVEEDIREHCFGYGYGMDLYRLAVGIAWKWRTPRGRLLPVPAVPQTGHEIAAARSER